VDVPPSDVVTGRQLGGGGFAVVYEGRHAGRAVAVKMIVDPTASEDQLREFNEELAVMARLSHPNIVRLLGACTKPPRQCFLMELCAGGSLFSLLHGANGAAPGGAGGRPAPLPLAHGVAIARDVAAALAYLHSLRPPVIHRDVKSLNVLLATPYEAGAGAAGAAAASPPSARLTDFGLVATRNAGAGTPNYMAPELLAGRPFGKPVDVYAFGVLLWEICSRAVPFAGWRPADIRTEVVAGARPDLRALPLDCGDALKSLITACWAPDAARRPDMVAVAKQLAEWRPAMSALAAVAGSGAGVAAAGRPAARSSTSSAGGGGGGGGDALDSMLAGGGGGAARKPAVGAVPAGRGQ
jgi:serine/threonine protein kinase